jgi:hypothetical protein
MAVSTNYAGKSIDLCILETGQQEGADSVNIGISSSGQVISGPYKVAQKYLKFLLTDVGSISADPNYGTRFLTKLLSGAVSNNQSLQLQFYSSSPAAVTYVLSSNTSPPPDETLVGVGLDSFSVAQDTATLKIRLSFADSSTITVPVTISTI